MAKFVTHPRVVFVPFSECSIDYVQVRNPLELPLLVDARLDIGHRVLRIANLECVKTITQIASPSGRLARGSGHAVAGQEGLLEAAPDLEPDVRPRLPAQVP